jgi:hypothetical protein
MKDNNMNELLKSLETLYLEGKYEQAREQILKNKLEFSEGLFHYNLGTVLSKTGKVAAGRYHFEKAQKAGYVDTKNLNNLEYVKSQLQVNDLSTSDNFGDQAIESLMSIPVSLYLSMTLILFITFVLFIKYKIVSNNIVKILLFVIALSPIALNQLYLNKKSFAVSLQEVKLHEGPSKVYEEKGTVPAGAKFLLGRFDKGWVFIERPLQLSGWVRVEALGIF